MTERAHLAVEGLEVRFPTPRGELHAVRGVSFEVGRGEMFGIVGESGCGKTATGRAVMKLVPRPGRIAAGRILYHGEDLARKRESEMRGLRGRRIGMVFQDPSEALNPLFTVGRQLERIMRRHRIASPAERPASGRNDSFTTSACRTRPTSSGAIRTSCRGACSSG